MEQRLAVGPRGRTGSLELEDGLPGALSPNSSCEEDGDSDGPVEEQDWREILQNLQLPQLQLMGPDWDGPA